MDAYLKIRQATVEDSPGLEKCMQSAYAAYRARMDGKRLPPMDVDYRSEIENYPVWVVESEGHIIGGLVMDFGNGKASIANVAVSPGFRGQGLGGRLMRLAETTARENNFSELHLATHVLLDENVSLYSHLGWEETGRDESRVEMKKKI